MCVVQVCVCVYVWRACVFLCVCLGQILSLPSVTLRIQPSPDGADSHFLCWLTAFLVNNNNISRAFKLLSNNFLFFCPTEDGECKFIFIFEFCKGTVDRMNQEFYNLYLHHENSRVKPGCILLRLMVISMLGDDCLLRMREIITLLVKWELGVF